ncbi:MAG: hypothetical protein IKS19_00015 [Clostridia bacterium]|nr:hypothetical protein [Clostridia bacterium]
MKFYDAYKSFSELYNTVLRGNEIEFVCNSKHYYILPHWGENNLADGACFGEACADNNVVCMTEEELYNAKAGDTVLGEIIPRVEITWMNF